MILIQIKIEINIYVKNGYYFSENKIDRILLREKFLIFFRKLIRKMR